MKRIFNVCFGVSMGLLTVSLFGQEAVSFFDYSERLGINGYAGPLCKAVADINGDYRDDIIRFNGKDSLVFDIQANDGQLFETKKIGQLPDGDGWAIAVGDLDNDGFPEIITGGFYNGAFIYNNVSYMPEYELSQTTIDDFFTQAANVVDIDNDGFLDVFICNDDGLSKIFINDGTGQLVENQDFIDMRTTPDSDNSGNYGSIWTDIDGDNDLDLYISKCRVNVNEPTDPRRINMLFLNENGQYIEAADSFGLAIGAQSWATDFGDIDNDGDLDAFMVNHGDRYMLLENIDNDTFVEIMDYLDGNLLFGGAFQCAFEDFNNDGWLDILIAGDNDMLLVNEGDKTFKMNATPFGFVNASSFAFGDLNADGYTDVMTSFGGFDPSPMDADKLYLNLGGPNNYIDVSLKGDMSNGSGIGSRVDIYGNFGHQVRVLSSGESYGITNSLSLHFGLGAATLVDSLRITWPSGWVDVYYELSANAHYLAHEGKCMGPLPVIESEGFELNCNIDKLILDSGNPGDTLEWNNGVSSTYINVTVPGVYYATRDTGCCAYPSQTIIIRNQMPPAKPVLNLQNDIRICVGTPLLLTTMNLEEVSWSTGGTALGIDITESGHYWADHIGECFTTHSDTIAIDVIDPELSPQTVTIESPSEVTFTVSGDSIVWYADSLSAMPIAMGETFTTGIVDRDTVFYARNIVKTIPPAYTGGESLFPEPPNVGYSSNLLSGAMWFEVFKNARLKSFWVKTDTPGPRRLLFYDDFLNLHAEKLIQLDTPGIYEIVLEIDFTPGFYTVTTDESMNEINFGFPAPRLSRNDGNNQYPYLFGDAMSITGSNFGPEFYYYFYDWSIELILDTCESALAPFSIELDTVSSVVDAVIPDVKIYPNPAIDVVWVHSKQPLSKLVLSSIQGKIIVNRECWGLDHSRLDIAGLKNGVYILHVQQNIGRYSEKLIVTGSQE